ncbi:hypothetical protein [Pseudoxanthomonas beigongshangi]
MAEKESSGGGGIGFCGLLTIVFITLKLLGVIAWSWWWVLSPILISIGIALTILFGLIGVALFSGRKR